MNQHHADQIAEAERRLARCLQIASKPGATIEDELTLQIARNRLLSAELKAERERVRVLSKRAREAPKAKPRRLSARERADAMFNLPEDS